MKKIEKHWNWRIIEFKTISNVKISEYNNITYKSQFQSVFEFDLKLFLYNFK